MSAARKLAEKALAQVDWAKVDAMSEEELKAIIAADPNDVLLTDEELDRPLSLAEAKALKPTIAPAAE